MAMYTKLYEARILVVDDNPVNLGIVQKILENEGYHNVEVLEDPTLVERMYTRRLYDAVLLDIHMPVLDGFQVMERLAVNFPNDYLPILVLTADHSEHVRNQALSSGAKDFISKPFDRIEVLLRVKNLLEVCMLHRRICQDNQILEERVRERTRQLFETQVNLIRCLGKVAEYRDNETGMHVLRMSESSAILAHKMGLSDDEVDVIRHASPMHDIGKIAIPDSILLKQGKLTDDEWEVMKQHTVLGAEILAEQDSVLMETAAHIAQTHHEKWDGSGYPKGLKGEDIPLYTRIITVCDVFDALTSTRPYKQAWPVEQAINYLRENAGTAFDPAVVKHFETIIDQVLALREHYPDEPMAAMDNPSHPDTSRSDMSQSYAARHKAMLN